MLNQPCSEVGFLLFENERLLFSEVCVYKKLMAWTFYQLFLHVACHSTSGLLLSYGMWNSSLNLLYSRVKDLDHYSVLLKIRILCCVFSVIKWDWVRGKLFFKVSILNTVLFKTSHFPLYQTVLIKCIVISFLCAHIPYSSIEVA